jgi:hypothetical protein
VQLPEHILQVVAEAAGTMTVVAQTILEQARVDLVVAVMAA